MKKTIRVLWALIAVLTVQVCFISCSDDEPDNKEGQQTEEWRKDLRVLTMRLTHHPTLFGGGGSFDMTYRFFAAMQIVDQNGNDLMSITNPNNVIDSDFYFEYQGKRYCVGDTLDFIPESFRAKQKTVKIIPQISGAPYTLYLFMAYPHMGSVIDELTEPIDITYSFVWPSKGIRKSFRVYCEKNVDLLQDIEAATTDENGFKKAELFRYGMWENGVSTKGEQGITITVD